MKTYLATPDSGLGAGSSPSPLFGAWTDVEDAIPITLVPIIAWGVLDGEGEPAAHEAFRQMHRAGTHWWFSSVRGEEHNKMELSHVTHWMPMPDAPNVPDQATASETRRQHDRCSTSRCLHPICSSLVPPSDSE